MAEIIGREIEVGIATEATRGTAETAADRWVKKTSATIVERATHAVDESTYGKFEEGQGRRVTQKYIEGELAGIVHVDAIGYIFANLYGACVSTLVSSGVYSHVFNMKQGNQHISLSIFAKDGSVQQRVYSNCMVNTLQMSVAIEDYIRFSATFIGSAAAANSDTPTYSNEYDFIARDVVVKMAATSGGLAGATAIKVKALELNWDAGVIRDHVVGTVNPDDNYNSQMVIEGTFTLNFDNTTYRDLYLGDTAQYMSITITGEANLAAALKGSITIVLNKVQLMDWNRDGDGSDLVTEPISFRAFYNAADQKQSQVTLQNLTTSYPSVPAS